MLTGQSILCFAPGPWSDMWRNRHQILSRLARTNTVLWVEPRLSLKKTREHWRDGSLSWLPHVEHIRDGLHVYHNPALLPSTGPQALRRVSNKLYHSALQYTLRRLHMDHPILWLYLPEMAAIIGEYEERLVVYHCIDEYTSYAGIPQSYIPTMRGWERLMLSGADVVLTTAPALFESKSPINGKVYLVPNAVDYDGFQRTLASADAPAAMTALPKPVIGYVGAINDKLDYALLASIATARPDWSLAMVGPATVTTQEDIAGLATLRRQPNVHFLGQVAVSDVPRYMAACQVCLLPYKVNERTRNISSLKMYEYLACGKPIVATDVPAAHEVRDVVRIAGASAFVAAIEESLTGPAAAEQRRQVAAANTWDQRVEAISAVLEENLREVDNIGR